MKIAKLLLSTEHSKTNTFTEDSENELLLPAEYVKTLKVRNIELEKARDKSEKEKFDNSY